MPPSVGAYGLFQWLLTEEEQSKKHTMKYLTYPLICGIIYVDSDNGVRISEGAGEYTTTPSLTNVRNISVIRRIQNGRNQFR